MFTSLPYSAGHVELPNRVLLLCSPCAPRHRVPCSASRVVPGAHRVVGPGTHRGSGAKEVHTTTSDAPRTAWFANAFRWKSKIDKRGHLQRFIQEFGNHTKLPLLNDKRIHLKYTCLSIHYYNKIEQGPRTLQLSNFENNKA
jgi:hypothetical protein